MFREVDCLKFQDVILQNLITCMIHKLFVNRGQALMEILYQVVKESKNSLSNDDVRVRQNCINYRY